MTRLFLISALSFTLAACSSDTSDIEPVSVEALPDTMALGTEPDTMTVADEDAEDPAAQGSAQYPNAGSTERPLRGVEICEELETALLAMRINAYDLDLYAAQSVIDELRSNTTFRDPETGQNEPDDVASWVEENVSGPHCNLSAGGDAWYRIQLTSLSGGRGDYATGFEITTSYDNGGP